MDIKLSSLRQPWVSIDREGADVVSELLREVTRGHVLFGRDNITALATREDSDDVLFLVDGVLAVVHLTYSGAETDPRWPYTDLYSSWSEFISERMKVDAAEFGGKQTDKAPH